jgi:nucleoside-diphosphate-sugar epimerase
MKRILVLGVGLVGGEVVRLLRAIDHVVIGTTTTPERVPELRTICDEVIVLRGSEAEKLAAAAASCDAIVNTVGPNLQRASNPATREMEYRESLSVTSQHAVMAHPRCIFGSSLSVYGSGEGAAIIDENTARTDSADASPRHYRQAEDAVLGSPQGVALRLPDLYGAPNDLSYADRVKFAHSVMGGTVPFAADALLYRLHARDAARAFVFALENQLTGAYNVVADAELPPTNSDLLDKLAIDQGLAALNYAGNIQLPNRPISAAKIRAAGFEVKYTDYKFN